MALVNYSKAVFLRLISSVFEALINHMERHWEGPYQQLASVKHYFIAAGLMKMNSIREEAYEKFARTGFAIKGAIYVLLGILAVVAAVGPNGKVTGKEGVLQWLDHQPLGPVLLVLIMVGLLGYVVLRFMQAFKDTNNKGTDWKGITTRILYFIRGVSYILLVFACFFIVFPGLKILDKEDGKTMTKVIELPAGNIAVAMVGAFFIGFGIFEIGRALTGSFKHHLNLNSVTDRIRGVYNTIGVIGYLARGIILCLIGFLIVEAAFNAYVDKAPFTTQAFNILSSLLGEFYMGIVAAGLAFYGIFYIVKARHYQVTID